MEFVSTPSCSYCGKATSDYLEHLLDLHKFSLAKAREVIGASSSRGSIEKAKCTTIDKNNVPKDNSVLMVGSVPIALPTGGVGGSIHIHIHTGKNDSSSGDDAVQEIKVSPAGKSDGQIKTFSVSPKTKRPVSTSSNLSLEAKEAASASTKPAGTLGHSSDSYLRTSEAELGHQSPSDSKLSVLAPKNITPSAGPTSKKTLSVTPDDLPPPEIPGNSDDDGNIEIVREIENVSKARSTIPNLSILKEEPVETKTKLPSEPLSSPPANNKRKLSNDQTESEKNKKKSAIFAYKPKILATRYVFSKEEKEMFKYERLSGLLNCGTVHRCQICNVQFPSTLEEIQKHVKGHGINILQYHAIYFNQKYWHHVSFIGCLPYVELKGTNP